MEQAFSTHVDEMIPAAAASNEVGWTGMPTRPADSPVVVAEPACEDRTFIPASVSAQSQPGRTLVKQFAVLSFLVIGLITVALSVLIAYTLRKDLLDREWGTTADFVRTETLQHLSPADFAAPLSASAQDHFAKLYHETVVMPEIVRVK